MSAAPDLQALYTRHHRLVRWIVRGSGVPERSVDDVIQDVFVTIHRRRAQATEGDVRRWIVGVTRSVCHSHRRAAARRRDRLARLGEPEPEPSLERWLEGKHALVRLDTVLAAIDPAQREAWILVELEGSSAPEVAEMLGVNVNTIYSRVRLARRRIETAFADADTIAERLRTSGDPAPERARGVWAGIALRLSPAATAAPALAGGAATGVLGWLGGMTIGGAIGAGLIGAIAWARAPTPREPPGRRDANTRDAAVTADDELAPASRPDEPPEAPTPALARSAAGTPTQVAAPTTSAHDAAAPSARPMPDRSRARRSDPDPDEHAAAPEPASMLAAESKLLREAARAIDRGSLDEAATLLDRHARDHEAGTLRPERERLRDRLQQLRREEAEP